MSTETWHKCDFPKCGRTAVWIISRPKRIPEPNELLWAANQQMNYVAPLDEFCQDHALGLIHDHEKFLKDVKATA